MDHFTIILPAAFLCAFSVALHLCALYLFPKWNILDFPERYGHKRKRLPYPTGILSVLSFLVFFIAYADTNSQTIGIALSVFLLALSSFIDDRYQVPASMRLGIQALAAFLIFATGSRIYTLTNPLELVTGIDIIKLDTIDIMTNLFGPLPFWSGVFTIFWIMLTTNALNWFDGIPGQVSVLSTIGFLTIGLLSLSNRVNQPELAILAFVLAGIACAGLIFDFPPNKVLMGDTGAMFFGLMLGVLTIYSGGKVATAFLVLGVPLIDLFIVITRRILKRESITRGNAQDEHLHHRLLSRGWTERQVIILTASLGTAFGVTALFLDTLQKFVAAIVLFFVIVWITQFPTQKKRGQR